MQMPEMIKVPGQAMYRFDFAGVKMFFSFDMLLAFIVKGQPCLVRRKSLTHTTKTHIAYLNKLYPGKVTELSDAEFQSQFEDRCVDLKVLFG